MATATMISSKVKPRNCLARTVNIKFDLLGLASAGPCPLGGENYSMETGNLRAVVIFQSRIRRSLNQFHSTVTGIDVKFLRRFGWSGCGLHFRHPIRQNQMNAFFLGVERAGVEAILDRATEREHSESKDRHAHQHFIERECAANISHF